MTISEAMQAMVRTLFADGYKRSEIKFMVPVSYTKIKEIINYDLMGKYLFSKKKVNFVF